MASAAYENATLRAQEILRRSADVLGGFSAENDITDITYAVGTDIPESITFSNSSGTTTRNLIGFYGDIGLTNDELFALRENRIFSGLPLSRNYSLPAGNDRPPARFSLNDEQTNGGNFSDVLPEQRNVLKNTSKNRLDNSSLTPGAETAKQDTSNFYSNVVGRFPSAGSDTRVKISDPSGRISQLGGALEPLRQTDYKVVFPYTPEINITHQASYSDMNPTHSNYEYLFYQNSVISEITISAVFTARNSQDAEYVLSVQHFFRSATKMFYGNDDIAGLPPIVCRLEGHGDLQFSYVPIVITAFSVTLPSDVDYISAVNTKSNVGRVPTMQTMNITAKPIYSRSRITNEFSLTDFARGNLLGNPQTGRGGFI